MLAVLRARGVAYLLGTSLIGRLAQAMSALALVRLVVDQGGSYGHASILSATFVLAGMIGQPLLSRTIDRTGRRRAVLMTASALATAGYLGAAAAATQLPALGLIAVAVAGFSTPPIEPALRALWPELAGRNRLTQAFALDAATQEVGFILGPLVTTLGIAVVGPQGNVLLMGAFGLVGGFAFAAHPRLSRFQPTATDGRRRHGSPLAEPALRRLLIAVCAIAIPVGALTIIASRYAELVGLPDVGSWAIAVNGSGALVGAILAPRILPRRPAADLIRPLGVLVALLYLPTAAFGLPPAWWLAAAFVAGLLLPPLLTQVFSHTPETVTEQHRTEANAWVISAFAVGIAAGTLVVGFVVEAVPGGAGIGIAVGATVALGVIGATQAAPRALAPKVRVQAGSDLR
jgi:MFS family permease